VYLRNTYDDVKGRLVGVTVNGTPQLYTVYDGSNPYLDFNSSGQLTQRYLYNPNALSQFYGQVSANGTVQWFLTDNINSIRQVVSSGGSVLDALTYDPYGNILNQTNAANAPRFLYAGGAYDSLTGYDQFGRRYYDPSDGRWTSQDPLGFKAGDTDLYRYVANDPTNAIDPNGLETPTASKGLPPGGAAVPGYYHECDKKAPIVINTKAFRAKAALNNVDPKIVRQILDATIGTSKPWTINPCKKWAETAFGKMPPMKPTGEIIGAKKFMSV
jgi:RHS repeat-associated protein